MRPSAASQLSPSALLSSRWSRDNLITPEIARLYTGAVTHRVGVGELELHLARLRERSGPLEVESGALGVLSWNIRCARRGKRSLLLVPLTKDADGVGGRSKRLVPERSFEHARSFRRRKLDRYLLAPEHLFEVEGVGRGASFSLPNGYSALTFGLGSARIDLVGDVPEVACLDRATTEVVTTEMLAALAYHYDADAGAAMVDVLVNDGDFLVRRDEDSQCELRMTCVRRIETGIDSNRFILYLVQLMAYEDWNVGSELVGLPVLVSSPDLAFAGFVRGTGLRYHDMGRSREAGEEVARSRLHAFARSREGRAYFPWVQRFLAGRGAEMAFSARDEPRRPWWNLVELEQRRELLRLTEDDRAHALGRLIERLEESVGRGTWDEADLARGNQSTGSSYLAIPAEEEGTLASLDRLPRGRPSRALANPELYGGMRAPVEHCEELVRLLPSFESFMDDVLHDARFGYYAGRVQIGRGGHFSTHPEDLSPHYGRWIAGWAFEVHRELLALGHLTTDDAFPLIEFGAGNGRLARDVVDQVRERSRSDPAWRSFLAHLDYRIYELSDSLRGKQEALLAGAEPAVRVLSGDARHPAGTLGRDFPDGFRGFVVSNELPDAFGVHKVVLGADGRAEAVLVVPRLEGTATAGLPRELEAACRASDARLRELSWAGEHPGELLLDRAAFRALMTFLAGLAEHERTAAVDRLWFEELLVPAAALEPLARVLARGAPEYARALAREESGVIVYVNAHAVTFVQELGSVLRSGQILTIDYGDSTAGLIHGARRGKFPLRIYCDEGKYHPRPNHPYTRPGAQDITADVNFTDLLLAGRDAGLEVCYYGPERAVAGAELPHVLAAADQKPFANFASNPVFKVLALGRGATWFPRGPGLEQLVPLGAAAPSGPEGLAREAEICSRLRGLARECKSPLSSHGQSQEGDEGGES